jgi:hypothetical protein
MLSLFVKTAKAIPEWKLLLWLGIIILTIAGVSFIFHINTPKEKKNAKEKIHPYQFILLVDIVVIFLAYILYLFDI